ncbi:MAG: hypothetical protein ACRCXC_10755 [Legionella sp.]
MGTKEQFLEVEQNTPFWYRADPELINAFEQISHYYTQETSHTDLVSYGIAVARTFRGQKLFHRLQQQRKIIAQNEQCNRLVFAVWETNPALSLFLHSGAEIIGDIDLRESQFKDRLMKCVFHL